MDSVGSFKIDGLDVHLVRDQESESYEPFSLIAYKDGRRAWSEGVRKDRSCMQEAWKVPVEKAMREAC